MINTGLEGTSVTVVLIGAETANGPWVDYEIRESIKRGNGLLGIRIHGIKDQDGRRSARGSVPDALLEGNYSVHDWDRAQVGRWIERAAIDVGKELLVVARHGLATPHLILGIGSFSWHYFINSGRTCLISQLASVAARYRLSKNLDF